MRFNESNTVEQMILDAVETLGRTSAVEPMHDAPGWGASLGGEFKRVYSYEILPGESLSKVLEWSGGFTEQAFKDKIFLGFAA